ncbi:MAG: YgeY family selenium metabolism-linked hydrolase [Myxococcales bacterium]|nr:YgeY family selenium metabolism-linked hydrolase [Myxococcales bacterium]
MSSSVRVQGKAVLRQAEKYRSDVIRFMRDLIAIPGESTQERAVISRIAKEMRKVGFDRVRIDRMGNVHGRMGKGKALIAMDAHIDTVGIGSRKEWKWDPYKGKFEKGVIFGRGASDQRGGMVGMVYGMRVAKDLGLLDGVAVEVVGSVQEEDCDGLPWQYLIKKEKLRPRCVVITEPTNLNIYRGHRGRMEIAVTTYGVSCHGSAPERGRNAVYMMSRIIKEIEALNQRLKKDRFLGKGSVTVSFIRCETPSLCAVPNEAYIHLDRRLTMGETKQSALREVKDAVRRAGIPASQVKIEVLRYDVPSYTGLRFPTEKYYPTWVLPEKHPVCRAAVGAYREVFGKKPFVGKWTFSTNGVATMGMFKIPTVGFGPANEIYAHSTLDQVPVDHLVKAAAFYAAFPTHFLAGK